MTRKTTILLSAVGMFAFALVSLCAGGTAGVLYLDKPKERPEHFGQVAIGDMHRMIQADIANQPPPEPTWRKTLPAVFILGAVAGIAFTVASLLLAIMAFVKKADPRPAG